MVLPDDSGPYISTTLPSGYHHHSTVSSIYDPLWNVLSIPIFLFDHILMTAHLPNCFSIEASASSRTLFFAVAVMSHKKNLKVTVLDV